MNKDAINIFNGGLNYDLSPLTTPNNVLTDCVNGTFITFNGDEMSLQNDAGNTKILIPGTSEYVQLTSGFYPLGIKVFGGVMYIVSGSSPNATLYVSTIIYDLGVFVYDNNGIYYKSLITSNNQLLTNSTAWLTIGDKSTFINTYGTIEFGSYPSPVIDNSPITNGGLTYSLNPNSSSETSNLYQVTTINNTLFRAGTYVTFTELNNTNTSNISCKQYTNGAQTAINTNIYNVRLLQQLTNGFIDLTDDVWDKYATFKGGAINQTAPFTDYWFNDSNFQYYCANNFKGKLAVETQIEPLTQFTLLSSTIDYASPDYTLTFTIGIINKTGWNIPSVNFIYQINGVSQSSITAVIISNQATITVPTSAPKGSIITYQITPIFQYIDNGIPYTVNNELPSLYFNNYIISGSEILTAVLDELTLLPGLGLCINGYYEYRSLTLQDNNNNNLDTSLAIITTGSWQFYEDNYYHGNTSACTNALGTYTVDSVTNKAVLVGWLTTASGEAVINNLLANTIVLTTNAACQSVTLTVNLSRPITGTDIISLTQPGQTVQYSVGDKSTTQYTFTILPNVQYTLAVSLRKLSNTSNYYTLSSVGTINTPTAVDFAVIEQLNLWVPLVPAGHTTTEYYVFVDNAIPSIPSNLSVAIELHCISGIAIDDKTITLTNTSLGFMNNTIAQTLYGNTGPYAINASAFAIVTTPGVTITTSYCNCTTSSYALYEGLIFAKQASVTQMLYTSTENNYGTPFN